MHSIWMGSVCLSDVCVQCKYWAVAGSVSMSSMSAGRRVRAPSGKTQRPETEGRLIKTKFDTKSKWIRNQRTRWYCWIWHGVPVCRLSGRDTRVYCPDGGCVCVPGAWGLTGDAVWCEHAHTMQAQKAKKSKTENNYHNLNMASSPIFFYLSAMSCSSRLLHLAPTTWYCTDVHCTMYIDGICFRFRCFDFIKMMFSV